MKTISIKELHDRTGHWLRRVRVDGEIVVTERGTPVARMIPPARPSAGNPFGRRRLLPGVAKLIQRPIRGPDSAEVIASMRDGR
ncbi:MAG: type II toxin-antitoxin system prevent-host-death family antitoxin [Deltaproteobacteria bacterium]|nr:type II toxin-antitoxin system prevent-host-death family antitoxin [Deltaproteobacteria bacterium]